VKKGCPNWEIIALFCIKYKNKHYYNKIMKNIVKCFTIFSKTIFYHLKKEIWDFFNNVVVVVNVADDSLTDKRIRSSSLASVSTNLSVTTLSRLVTCVLLAMFLASYRPTACQQGLVTILGTLPRPITNCVRTSRRSSTSVGCV